MKKRKINHRIIHLFLVGLILLGFVVFSFGKIVVDNKISGEPVRSLDGGSLQVSDEGEMKVTGGQVTCVSDDDCAEGEICYNNECVPCSDSQCLGCTDVDGENPYVYGFVTNENFTLYDKCSGSTNLWEGVCLNNDNKVYQALFTCEYGCMNGFCLISQEVACLSNDDCLSNEICFGGICQDNGQCEENDGGNKIYNSGTTFGNYSNGTTYSFDDKCIDDFLIEEHYCQYDIFSYSSVYNCSDYDSVCENGACVPPPDTSCYDTDGGDKIFTRGALFQINEITVFDSCLTDDGSISYVPSCEGENCFVEEKVCRGLGFGENYYGCPQGCDEGACLPKLHEDCDYFYEYNGTSAFYNGYEVRIHSIAIGLAVKIKVKTGPTEDIIPNYLYDFDSIKYEDFMITIQHIGNDYVGFCFNNVTHYCPYCLDLIEESTENDGCDPDREQYGYPGSYYVKGDVGPYTDRCIDENVLSELICLEDGTAGWSKQYLCHGGCFDGACVDCTPSCSGKQCGSDGCGGSCGTCPTGSYCGLNAPSGICGYPENWPKEDCDNPKNKFNPACAEEALK